MEWLKKNVTAANDMEPRSCARSFAAPYHRGANAYCSRGPCPEYCGGQWRFKGYVTCFPQDIQPVVSVLLRVSIEVLVLRSQQSANADAMREFRVSRQRVHNALLWLIEHNCYYGDISVSVKNLEKLPDDGPL